MNQKNNTIVALATAPGKSAISVIRVSGERAISLVNSLFKGKNLEEVAGHTAHFGKILNQNQVIDEVLVTVFKAPSSYTGEDLVEISCHGNPLIVKEIIQLILDQGARNAEAGEFTLRAFLNGKLDLSQAEAVADIIASESFVSRDIAMKQLRGGYSQKIRSLRDRLIEFASLIELELDFSEEDVEFAERTEFKELLNTIEETILALTKSYSTGNAIKEGINTVIAGRPNAGKSTLLNALLDDERAIVSDIPGTTRDSIEDQIIIEGYLFRFIDTAGIRKTDDLVEKIGVERTMKSLEKADLILYLYDPLELSPSDVSNDLSSMPKDTPKLVIANKSDKLQNMSTELDSDIIAISALNSDGLDSLKSKILGAINLDTSIADKTLVTNTRHYEALSQSLRSIQQVKEAMNEGLSTDLLAIDLRVAIQHLSEITGEVSNDDILGSIFSKFCIGK